MSGETNICVDCKKPYTFSTSEKARFDSLMKTVAGFQMPKRCFECRTARRNDERHPAVGSVQKPVAPKMVGDPPSQIPPLKKGEVRLVLATVDFENLVSGRPVSWQGVTVVLADIGYKAMHDAIDRVEQDKMDAKFNR